MKGKLSILIAIAVLLAVCSVTTQVIAAAELEGKEVDVKWKQVPKAVKATMLKEAKGSKILGVEKATDAKGVVTYSADVMIGGKLHDVIVATNGKLIKVEQDAPEAKETAGAKTEAKESDEGAEPANEVNVAFDKVPPAVQKAIKKWAGNGKIGGVEKGVTNGKTIYSADVTKNGKMYDVIVAEDGKLIKSAIDAPAKAGKAAPEGKEAGEKD